MAAPFWQAAFLALLSQKMKCCINYPFIVIRLVVVDNGTQDKQYTIFEAMMKQISAFPLCHLTKAWYSTLKAG
ncbi:MAG: hypothetical protein Q4G28_04835 [Neisseria sp.]|nr:hypothetical protein [Neisseria sp.]